MEVSSENRSRDALDSDLKVVLVAVADHAVYGCVGLLFVGQVYIIKLLGDKKFEHFRSVLDAYIQTHFSGAMAHM